MWVSALLYNIMSLFGIAALIFFSGVWLGTRLGAKSLSAAKVRFACSFLFVLLSFCALKFLSAIHALFLAASLAIGFAGICIGFKKHRILWKELLFRSRKKDIAPISIKEH